MKQIYTNFDHEYLLLRNTLRKLGVWNEYLMEKKKRLAFLYAIPIEFVDEEYIKKQLMKLQLHNRPGRLIRLFNLTSVSFPWVFTEREYYWEKIYRIIRFEQPMLQHLNRITK